MKNLIYSKDNSIEPNGAIGFQSCGIIFWQKTGFLRHCNERGFQSIVTLITKKFPPTSVQLDGNICFIQFDNDVHKMIFLMLKKDIKSNNQFIYGESHTVYADAEFHLFALNFVSYIAKQIGCKFYVDDATGYLEHRDKARLNQYINDFDIKPTISQDLLRDELQKHARRPLDINEILSRDTQRNVMVDAYEYFMRQSKWEINDQFNETVQNFLLCVMYCGFIGNGGISVFFKDNGGKTAHRVADALNIIGAVESEKLLRQSFQLFPNGVIPENDDERKVIMEQIDNKSLDELDIKAYNADIDTFCYRYLMKNKKNFLSDNSSK